MSIFTYLITTEVFNLRKTCVHLCQSVISGSLTLRDTKIRDFRVKFYFSKFRMEPVIISFLAPTENTSEKIRTTDITIAGKYLRKQREIAIRNFQIQNKTRVEPSYPEIGGEIITRKECNYSN